MIGNVIQSQYLSVRDYPTAAALSFVVMVIVLILIAIAARAARHQAPAGGRGRVRTTVDRIRDVAIGVWAVLALIYLFIPIFVIVLFSFNDNQGRFNFTWQGFTLKHWQDPFKVEQLQEAFVNSLTVAAVTTLIAVALGTFVALALVRYRWRGRGAVSGLVFLPLATPEVVLGAALLGWFLTLDVRARLRDGDHRPRHVHARLCRRDDPCAPGGDGPPHRGGRDGPRRKPVDDDPQDHAPADHARASWPRACSRSRSRSTTSS